MDKEEILNLTKDYVENNENKSPTQLQIGCNAFTIPKNQYIFLIEGKKGNKFLTYEGNKDDQKL